MPRALRKRASLVCVDAGDLLCVRLRDPLTGLARLFVPGGAIEAGETASQAAHRETLEETGLEVEVRPDSELVAEYPFVWNGVEVACTTHFFAGELRSPRRDARPVDDAAYHEGVVWLPLPRLSAELGFHADIESAVRRMLCRGDWPR